MAREAKTDGRLKVQSAKLQGSAMSGLRWTFFKCHTNGDVVKFLELEMERFTEDARRPGTTSEVGPHSFYSIIPSHT